MELERQNGNKDIFKLDQKIIDKIIKLSIDKSNSMPRFRFRLFLKNFSSISGFFIPFHTVLFMAYLRILII